MDKPVMVIVAGANGSGKSSNTLPFARKGYDVIDPDRIARNLSPNAPEKAALSAGKAAINRAKENISLGNSFTIETTLASKGVYQRLINEALSNNFEIKLAYISTVSPDINIERVASRVAKGGHDVPEKDILRRYERSLDNVGLFFDRATEKVLIDNSTTLNDFNLQLHVKDNKTLFVIEKDKIASWVSRALGKDRLNKIYDQVTARIAEGIHLGERTQQISTHYQWSKADMKMLVNINGNSPANINENVLSKIIANDKFLSCYSMADIQSGKLDLSVANGVQPVPKIYDSQGMPVTEQASQKPLKLK